MKLIKASSGKKTIKITKDEWIAIGKKAGWTKTARQTFTTPEVITDYPGSTESDEFEEKKEHKLINMPKDDIIDDEIVDKTEDVEDVEEETKEEEKKPSKPSLFDFDDKAEQAKEILHKFIDIIDNDPSIPKKLQRHFIFEELGDNEFRIEVNGEEIFKGDVFKAIQVVKDLAKKYNFMDTLLYGKKKSRKSEIN